MMRQYLILPLIIIGYFSYSQDTLPQKEKIKFKAHLNKDTLSIGQSFYLTFTLNGTGQDFVPPPLDDFITLFGPTKSTNSTIIGEATYTSEKYTFVLKAKEKGNYNIGKASINVHGITYLTNELSIVADDTLDPDPQYSNFRNSVLYFREVSNEHPSINEELRIDYKLIVCKDVQIEAYNEAKSPTYNGYEFIREYPKRSEKKDTIYHGKKAYSMLLFSDRIFLNKKGSLETGETLYNLCFDIPTGRKDSFGTMINEKNAVDLELSNNRPIKIEE